MANRCVAGTACAANACRWAQSRYESPVKKLGTMMRNRILPLAMGVCLLAAAPAVTVKTGVDKWQAGDYKAAVTIWQPFAARGDTDALFNLGQAYKLGRGVAQDLAMAQTYYRRAAERGHAPAATNLGILTAQGGDKQEAARWWTKAAEAGEARAQYMLGVMYFNGDSVPKNWPIAYAYMSRANNSGFQAASAALEKMNAHIPQEQRQKGEALAAAPDRLRAEIPASVTGAPLAATAKPTQTAQVTPAAKAVGKPAAVPPAGASTAKVPAPVPAAATAVADANPWRLQLGAYGQMPAARQGWDAIRKGAEKIIGDRQPVYAESGKIIRLQLGGFRDRTEAQALCGKLTTAGRSCFVVKTAP